jgi:hypothetical protein
MSGLKRDMGAVQRAIQMLSGTYDKDVITFEVAKITAVDTTNWLCTAQLVSSKAQNMLSNIQLTAEKASNGFVQVPKIGSNVILATTFRNQVYVFMCSEVDALVFHQQNSDGSYEEFVINCNSNTGLPLGIQLIDGSSNGIVISSHGTLQMNDGSLGGLTKTQELQKQLNALNKQVQEIISVLTTWTVVPQDGGKALQTMSNLKLSPLQNADFSQIENKDVTHGPKT